VENPAKLVAASGACLLLAAFNAYIVNRARTTGKIRSRSATYNRDGDAFAFYATLWLHVGLASASACISGFFS